MSSSTRGIVAWLVAAIAVAAVQAQDIEVYERAKSKFETSRGTVKGFTVRARTTFDHPALAILDASHDHLHMSEMDKDIKREQVVETSCTKEICLINVHVLVGSFFPVGKITYDLETEVEGSPEEGFVIDWHKSAGTKFIKYLHGRLKLTPVGDGDSTQVDYLAEVSASRLSLAKVERRAVDYLERLHTILEERHEGHPSLWAQIEEGSQP